MREWDAYQTLRRMGVTLRLDGDRLMAGPPGAVTAEAAEVIRANRDGLAWLLAARAEWAAVEAGFVWRPCWAAGDAGRLSPLAREGVTHG